MGEKREKEKEKKEKEAMTTPKGLRFLLKTQRRAQPETEASGKFQSECDQQTELGHVRMWGRVEWGE